jgi:hypothetical protein
MLLPVFALTITLLQPAPTVPVTLDGQVRVVSVVEAEEMLRSGEVKLREAAVIALGTRYVAPESIAHLAPHDLQRERWQRQPAQRPIPNPDQ